MLYYYYYYHYFFYLFINKRQTRGNRETSQKPYCSFREGNTSRCSTDIILLHRKKKIIIIIIIKTKSKSRRDDRTVKCSTTAVRLCIEGLRRNSYYRSRQGFRKRVGIVAHERFGSYANHPHPHRLETIAYTTPRTDCARSRG